MKQIILIPIYYFLKAIVWVAIKIYNPSTFVLGKKNLYQKGPLIVVSNHPNTLLDPLHVAVLFHRYVYFLANASLFKNKIVGWLLNQLYCIPVQRMQDTGGKPLNNVEAFKRSTDFLANGGCLYVAPEGTSWMEKRLHPIKTGTARIALSYAKDCNFEKELMIIAVGLVYDKPNFFGSKVRIKVCDPIKVSDYQTDYYTNEKEAVRKLTNKMEVLLKSSIIHTETIENEQIFTVIQDVYYGNSKEKYLDKVIKSQEIAEKLIAIESNNTPYYGAIAKASAELKNILAAYGLDIRYKNEPQTFFHSAFLLLGLPLFLVGFVFNWLVALFPMMIRKWVKPVVEYHSTFNVLGGLIGLMILYPFNIYCMEKITNSTFGKLEWWGMVFGMLLLGTLAKWWEIYFDQLLKKNKWKIFEKNNTNEYQKIEMLEHNLLDFVY